jgi:Transposase DDE domain group 1
MSSILRPGNAGANTATDHVTVLDRALEQIPAQFIETIEILVRADSAGATHELAVHCHDGNRRFSFGYELTESVRVAILEISEDAWVRALDADGSERDNGQVAEITDRVDLSSWPQGSRLIVRRERPHPGAQLSFTDHDGYRFQAILTDQSDKNIAVLERRHRQRARVEDRIRYDKDTVIAKFPFKEFALNEVWLQIVMLAHDLIVWTQALLLTGELTKVEPKRLRYRLFHVAAASRSTDGALSSASNTTGPGATSSSPPSTSSKRSQPPPADHGRSARTTKQPSDHGRDHPCPHTRERALAVPPNRPTPPPTTPTNVTITALTTSDGLIGDSHAPTARSGLGGAVFAVVRRRRVSDRSLRPRSSASRGQGGLRRGLAPGDKSSALDCDGSKLEGPLIADEGRSGGSVGRAYLSAVRPMP